jgi:hypothetical protein
MDENQMWEVIGLVIKDYVKENEAIRSGSGIPGAVLLTYSVIVKNSLDENTLCQCHKTLDEGTLRLMTVPTLRIFMKEVIYELRSDAE